MKIVSFKGMVNISSQDFEYSNIRNMYQTGDGVGIQTSKDFENKEIVMTALNDIASSIYKLQDILDKSL